MAKFYGGMQGNGQLIERSGTRKSGMWTHLRTHTLGIVTEVAVVDKETIFQVYETGGSENPEREKLIAEITESNRKVKK